ncbi:MAG: amidohydrolase family protein [bacterium]|nr:amidohydrolase family protein [bacterium]
MRTITLEEHFASPTFLAGPGRHLHSAGGVAEPLCDLGERRIAAMDEAGIDVQVLSLTAPGVEQLDAAEAVTIAREANDHVAEAVRAHPGRFAAFASLPTPDPEAAAGELERRVREDGFKGALINGHTRGRYLDDPAYAPVLQRAEALGVPIYVHPTHPPQPVAEASYGGFSPELTFAFSGPGWGWHIETATHVLRLILGGVFDRHPGLTVVIGHLGEALPFMLPRFDAALPPAATKLQRPVGDYLRENLYYTFGGFNWTPPFLALLLGVGADRIMFSADYPYASMARAREFLDQLPVSTNDRNRIAHGTAEQLLGL